MSTREERRPNGNALTRRLSGLAEAIRDTSPGEQVIVAAGLFTLERLVGVIDRMDSLIEEQRGSVRRSREIMELFPPLLGKLGDLLDLEIANARHRLEDRLRGSQGERGIWGKGQS